MKRQLLFSSRFFFDGSFSSPDSTCPAGGDKTNLSSGGSVPSDGRSLTNMLVITSSMRMLNGVHGDSSNLGP